LTTFIFASLWWVSHTGWIGPFALHIDIAVSYNERSWGYFCCKAKIFHFL
jgi:hypothetical protein